VRRLQFELASPTREAGSERQPRTWRRGAFLNGEVNL
jgi:hypothetical protein